ncbi:hypothetical protein INS49_014280 [Diaporthe citri]|uniref:uncharacterized protein n=1 Tax=Diaporthe citri TaxID=83186 RepID=UPI001C7F57C5|nr:uncharacterized protein INS49_014280 [Diaporthe citri]KAG6358396.1 hypothetical protein INS49_014280 [Diaporthe citri]
MNDDDQGPLMRGSVAAALLSATAFTAARVYCSVIVLHRTRREDVIILLSLVPTRAITADVRLAKILLWAGCILTLLAVDSGMGKHVDTLTVRQRADARFYYLVSVWPALLAITVPKVAVAGLITRIFTPHVWTKTIMSAVVCVGVVNYIVISALSTFQCQPLAASWDPRVRAAECVSVKTYLDLCYFTSSYSASVDCYLAIYPALVFRKMGFSMIKKISLSLVLGLGIGATAVACLKISYLHVLSNEDFTWTLPRLTIWTITEATVTIVAACIPVLHPLYDRARTGLRKLFPGLRRSDQGITAGHEVPVPGGAADPPGFWSLKLRAIGLAESWWSSTAGRTSRRSGARGQLEEEYTKRPASGTAVSGGDAVVVVHSEGAGRQSDLERSREVTVSVDGVVEMSDMERGLDMVSGQGPGQDSGAHSTVIGQK